MHMYLLLTSLDGNGRYMMKRGRLQKFLGISIAGSLLILIFAVLIPPTGAIDLTLGNRSPTSTNTGGIIQFCNVNITIRGIERIPITELNFTIFQGSTLYNNIKFDVFGNIISGDDSYFEIELLCPSSSQITSWFTPGVGYEYGYGERWGSNPGEGYGYGDVSESNITFCYCINYTTRGTGSFYGQLFAKATMNSITKIYHSNQLTFTVGSTAPEGVPAGSSTKILALVSSQETLENAENILGIPFEVPFYAKDTDGDNLVDEFTDPNGILTAIRTIRDGAKILFLLSSRSDGRPNLLWNSADDTLSEITSVLATVEETQIDTSAETVTVVISVEKDGWIYIEVDDSYPPNQYPGYTLTVRTTTGKTIPAEYIWREDGKIYILDDPTTQYLLIYNYDILRPLFSPNDGAEFSETRPTIIITYYEEVSIISAKLNGVDIRGMMTSTDMKTYNFTPSYNLASGVYELSITVQDSDSNTLTSTATYIVNLPYGSSTEGFPWLLITILAVILLIAAIIVILKLFIL